MLAATRQSVIDASIADDRQVDELLNALAAARGQDFRTVLGPLFVHVIAEVP
jgi:hypothetical protein